MYTSGVAEAKLSDFPVQKQILTFEFFYILVFAALQVLRATLYIGANNKLLEVRDENTFIGRKVGAYVNKRLLWLVELWRRSDELLLHQDF